MTLMFQFFLLCNIHFKDFRVNDSNYLTDRTRMLTTIYQIANTMKFLRGVHFGLKVNLLRNQQGIIKILKV